MMMGELDTLEFIACLRKENNEPRASARERA
jgi:hypothetical protein